MFTIVNIFNTNNLLMKLKNVIFFFKKIYFGNLLFMLYTWVILKNIKKYPKGREINNVFAKQRKK